MASPSAAPSAPVPVIREWIVWREPCARCDDAEDQALPEPLSAFCSKSPFRLYSAALSAVSGTSMASRS
jgi:hypothetical protein